MQNVEIQQKVQLLQTELTTLSEKQRQVVQQLKQNIQPRSEVYSRKQEFPTTKQHKMEASCNDVRTDLSTGNRKGKPVSHRPSILAMVGHSKFNPQVSNNHFACTLFILTCRKGYTGFS